MTDRNGHEASEVVEGRFEVTGMPRLRVRNVSGETRIEAAAAGVVFVRARKRVHGTSDDRAKRLLENVEVRMEQSGDEILVEPHLYQQERGWLDLFRGGSVAVDFDIAVPRESQIDATAVSGGISIAGTRGPLEVRSASGDVNMSDVQGPTKLRTVSGDARADRFAGQLEANSVSGEIQLRRSRVRIADIVTVSGDVDVEAAVPDPAIEGRLKTVSGDVELALAAGDFELEFKTVSGEMDVEREVGARIEKADRRDRLIAIGEGGARLRVKSVSGDLTVRRSREEAGPEEEPARAAQMAAPPPERSEAVMDVLERVSRGELSVDEAAGALDAARRSR